MFDETGSENSGDWHTRRYLSGRGERQPGTVDMRQKET